MNTHSVITGIVMVAVSLSFSTCKAAEKKTGPYRDTVVLAKSAQPFTIDYNKPFYQAELRPTELQQYDPSKKIWLLFDDPQVMQDPDGVYEIYITMLPADIKVLGPAMPGFVNVLDLYSLTNPEPKNYLVNDLSKHMEKWMKERQPFSPLFITVLFRGTLLPGNGESKKAGQLMIKGMRIVQEKG
jgi:hypothetical protein